ncbi:hypothetical protein X975_01676, partial [Stegodyphus mimosarum]
MQKCILQFQLYVSTAFCRSLCYVKFICYYTNQK